jgi:hypothetical protein
MLFDIIDGFFLRSGKAQEADSGIGGQFLGEIPAASRD